MSGDFKALSYFTKTLIFTSVLWFIGAYYSFQKESGFYVIFLLLGLMSPFVVALFMFSYEQKKEFYNKLFNLQRVDVDFIPFMILIIPFSISLSIWISLLFGESIEQFNISKGFSFSTGFIPVLLLLFLAATFEELGWRGYGFESLEKKFNFFYACLIFSLLWSIWHIPLSFVNNSYQYEIFQENIWYGINFYLSIIPLGFIISWVCYKNNKSIVAAILFHFIINLSQEGFDITQKTKIIQSFVLCFIAFCIVIYDRKLFFGTNK
jgi:membrane protease YdiL (CAAX protease family)